MPNTFLQAINSVLNNVGERSVQQLTTPVSRLAAQSVADALEEMSIDHDWQHLRTRVNALSWSLDTATLPEIVKLYNVGFARTDGVDFITFLHQEEYDQRRILPALDAGSFPVYYTYDGANKVRLNPYPAIVVPAEITDPLLIEAYINDPTRQAALEATRASIFFYVTRRMTQPTNLDSVLDLPNHLTPVLVKLASALMATRHTGDPRLAQGFRNEYERMLYRQRTVGQRVPAASVNMYQRRRRKGSGR